MIRFFNSITWWRVVQIAALVVSAVLGTMQLVSRADEKDRGPAQKKVAENASNKESGDLRKMAIRVRDEQGRPLAGVDVHASVWEIERGKNRFPNRDYTTNEIGVAEIDIPRRLLILRIWPSKASHAGYR